MCPAERTRARAASRVAAGGSRRGEACAIGTAGCPCARAAGPVRNAVCGALDKAVTNARAKAAAASGTTAAPLVPWTLHDLRRTVATGLQRLGVRLQVTEATGSRGGIAGVYQRHDWAAEKRAALDAWAAHLLAIVEQRTPAGNVVKLTRAR
jgi:hypothetical protein